jgi:parallel beta-helix repeat protein
MSSEVVGVGERTVMAAIALLLLLTSLCPAAAFAQPDGPIRVPRDYPTIQEAINAARPGDTILVSSGTYVESGLLINKTLTVVGEDPETTVIEYDGLHWNVFNIQNASDVTISNFTIKEAWEHGISLNFSSNCTVENNIIVDMDCGIYLANSVRNRILGNTITHWGFYGVMLFWSSHNNTISNNKIHNMVQQGIRVDLFSDNNTIRRNELSSSDWGAIFLGTRGNLVEDNILTENDIAIVNWGDSHIVGNVITQNLDGVLMGGGHAVGNTLMNNTRGLRLWEGSSGIVYRNNFVNNTQQLEGNASLYTWDNGCEGNYWSDYTGTDLDGDGVGDTSLPWQGVDSYPLMSPWSTLRIFTVYVNDTAQPILIHNNSTIASFTYEAAQSEVGFNATGPSGSVGFSNVTIPKAVLSGHLAVLIDDEEATSIITENATHTSTYFTYAHSTRRVRVFVPILGDVNVDGVVDIYDIVAAAASYGVTPTDQNWNPRADVAPRWGLIDIFDLVTVASRYGEQKEK